MNHLNQRSPHIHRRITNLVLISDNLDQSEVDLLGTLCLHQLLHLLKSYKKILLTQTAVLTHVSYVHDHMIYSYHYYQQNLVVHLNNY